MMAASQRYVGVCTPFGTIQSVHGGVYNPVCTVLRGDGSTGEYRLPFVIAHSMIKTGGKA